jgi:dienelactone hydrolase
LSQGLGLGLVLYSFAISAFASDLAKEKRWANQVVDAIMDGDAVWLNDGKSDFLSIYTEAAEPATRAVIVMHGTGIHPNWQQVVQPLRVGLTEHGWNTLSIQMPILANDAAHEDYAPLYAEVAPRINAAIKYLKEQGNHRIFLVGHSQGATMGAYFLRSKPADISGFVAIGLASSSSDERMNAIKSLEMISVPVLDLYGTEDLPGIIDDADQRSAAAGKANNKHYSQEKISGNHFFDGHNTELVTAVADWLKTVQ